MDIDKLDDIVNRYNNVFYCIIKMKPVDSSKEINDEDPKFKIGDIVRISKYKIFFQKAMFQIGLKKFCD